MKLDKIAKLEATLELVTGLHIGSGNAEMHIGGTDNPVIKHPVTGHPYVPGSSLKGKMRSLMEWHAGVVGAARGKPLGIQHLDALDDRAAGLTILRLFGYAPTGGALSPEMEALVAEIGPTRLAFWDCEPDPAWIAEMREKNLLLTETKMENSIDRIRGVAEHPRNTERVPAGARFRFRLTIKVIDGEDLMDEILRGLRLVELSGLGGSVSRGYGKVVFRDLHLDGAPKWANLDHVAVA